MSFIRAFFVMAAAVIAVLPSSAQHSNILSRQPEKCYNPAQDIDIIMYGSNLQDFDTAWVYIPRDHAVPPTGYYRPVVFDEYYMLDDLDILPVKRSSSSGDAYNWIDDEEFSVQLLRSARQRFALENSEYVKYNVAFFPEPPKHYRAVVDPTTTRMTIEEVKVEPTNPDASKEFAIEIERRNWIHDFAGAVQFSQSYLSPNWYQGGKGNLMVLASGIYNVKLNQKFHPNLLFETTVQYKLGMNSAPDDTIHAYNVSEDLFQVNSKFGLKAASRWYYSVNLMFKTQMIRSHKSNSRDLKSAFLSPGELNIGVGMTYNYVNPKKTLTFDASISPLSWNLKTCINNDINETAFGIPAGRNLESNYGSSADCHLKWKLSYNITYTSRLFVFTDYDYLQSDWENTISFDINRFLSTQIYVHLRYDSQTPRMEDTSWHKFQCKELLTFGFSYKFSNI